MTHPSSIDYTVYSFTPSNDPSSEGYFYEKSFDDKMKTLTKIIEKAGQLEGSPPFNNPTHRAIFVAPEYLFSNAYECGHESYYSKEQKNEFKQAMLQLSKKARIIIVPGTFRWWSQNEQGQKIYRNNAYLFFNGEVKHYNKHEPSTDYDYPHNWSHEPTYIEQSLGLVKKITGDRFNSKNPRFGFSEQSPLISIGGVTFGMEICADHLSNTLYKYLQKHQPEQLPQVHLLISDGVSANMARPIRIEDALSIHVDRSFSTSGLMNNQKASISRKGREEDPRKAIHYNYSEPNANGNFLEIS